MANDAKVMAAAYVPWKTLVNQIDRFAEQGLPNQIDKTLFGSLAGGTRNELMAALRFFRFIDDEGKPSPEFQAIVTKSPAERHAALKKVVEDRYAPLFSLDLLKVTPKQFNDKMGETYGMQGSTLAKAIRFFLAAAHDLKIPVSQYLVVDKRKGGNGPATPSPRRARKSNKRAAPAPEPPPILDIPATSGSKKVVTLSDGQAKVMLTVSKDVLVLSPSDRKFVLGLVEELEKYEAVTDSARKEAVDD